MMDVVYIVYRDRFNVVKAYSLQPVNETDKFLYGRDMANGIVKSFKWERLLSRHNDLDSAGVEAVTRQADFEIIPRRKREGPTRRQANVEGKFEICFTGFSKEDKSEMTQLAEEGNMFVRSGISAKLALLVCGKNAGWSKLEKANAAGIAKVY